MAGGNSLPRTQTDAARLASSPEPYPASGRGRAAKTNSTGWWKFPAPGAHPVPPPQGGYLLPCATVDTDTLCIDDMHVVYPRAAGLDVHKMHITATVRLCEAGSGPARSATREFSALPDGLRAMTDWLPGHGVTAAAMEGTGVYWKARFEALEDAGLAADLLNAQHVKAVTATARKIAVLFYNTMRYGMQYADPGASHYEARYRQRAVANLRRRAKALDSHSRSIRREFLGKRWGVLFTWPFPGHSPTSGQAPRPSLTLGMAHHAINTPMAPTRRHRWRALVPGTGRRQSSRPSRRAQWSQNLRGRNGS